MNPEAHKIVQEMGKHIPEPDWININNPGATHSYLTIQTSRLLILLAEDAEKSADKLARQTDRLAEQIKKLLEIADAQKQFAEQGIKQSENLSRQTDGLIGQVAALVIISDEQKNYAARLERQTNKLIWLTWALVIFSIALLVVSLKPAKIMFKQNAEAHIPQIETSQHQQGVSGQK